MAAIVAETVRYLDRMIQEKERQLADFSEPSTCCQLCRLTWLHSSRPGAPAGEDGEQIVIADLPPASSNGHSKKKSLGAAILGLFRIANIKPWCIRSF